MTIFEEKQYNLYMENGERLLNMAENYYEEKNLDMAAKAYYHASINFESAKELAKAKADCTLTINAKDKEFYCIEKIDELEIFKNVEINEVIR